MTAEDLKNLKVMRKKMFLAAYAGGSAHLASAFSSAEIFYALYQKKILRTEPGNPQAENRDRLVLSKGHASLAWYASLAMAGFISEEELYTFIQPGTRLSGEPCPNGVPGIEAATGSLGHGLSLGLGMALAAKLDQKDFHTYVILGDGECQEGTIWEAVMAAHKYQLGNLTAILDCNKIQKMGFIEETMRISSWRSKWESFGWQVDEIKDGHDLDEICEVLRRKNDENIPRLVVANTTKGKGVSIMENNPNWHYKMPNRREMKTFVSELEISEKELEKCREHI
ncbi:MAG: transketolase [Lachnospiraceae bacterium]|nr:transketolase [Lachnospiraceae bacterium]